MPAPGTYNPSDTDSNTGSYLLSQTRNQLVQKFMKPTKHSSKGDAESYSRSNFVMASETPGPGQYTITKELGQIFNTH